MTVKSNFTQQQAIEMSTVIATVFKDQLELSKRRKLTSDELDTVIDVASNAVVKALQKAGAEPSTDRIRKLRSN